ncbi:MAG: hypothetical protein ONB48_07410 [candidate division KSB1 bacterium]|nr:hypothetical protein [candidate division KSB1 bacterium]MDZ7274648.1 hypothetical protein [candidate division KSB1 bacterium]MDZ7285473.1 hypothetical protein [candidate division KSB1 bacterium]MDZ7298505.1 hypothetical protein [candidate division KSB1 bacterium]MDZ7306271.1 hypothetical protein [candidate division KSB1 bacterium]
MSSLVYSLRGRLRRVEPEKLWTYGLTTFFVLGIYLLLLQVSLPEPRFDVEKFREIDFSRFEPPKPKAPAAARKTPAEMPREAVANRTAPANIEEIDLSNLQDLTKMTQIVPQDLSALSRIASVSQALLLPEISVGTTTLPPVNAPVVANVKDGLPVLGTPSNVYNPNLASARVGYGGTPGGTGYATGRTGPLIGTKRNADIVHKIDERSFDEKKRQEIDFDKLFRELLEWLKKNQSELSPSLKHYMRYRNGDLTAKVRIATATSSYDLFFLCNETSQDIGLLMVEVGDSSTAIMLRDTGFRKKSFSLSKGIASRGEENNVTSVSMLATDPTRSETSKFYNIFLSWWENNKSK